MEMRDNRRLTADFRKSFKYLISHEGYYCHNLGDKGGETYAGISRVFNRKWIGWKYVDKYKRKHGKIEWNTHIPDKMLDFLVQDYYLDIWVKEGFYNLKDQSVCNHTMDVRLNAVVGGVRLIKKTLIDLGWKLNIDNAMDSITIHHINQSNKRIYLKTLEKRRIIFYNNIVRRDSSQRQFLAHWVSRSKI
jgi:hypothetical protein